LTLRAGLRAEVRDLVTRRDFAIRGMLAWPDTPEGTVANPVMDGQDQWQIVILGLLTISILVAKDPVQLVDADTVTPRQHLQGLTPRRAPNIGQFTKFTGELLR
jgi:hypothetical protein